MQIGKRTRTFLAPILALSLFSAQANALTLDWGGYFRADHNFVIDYRMNSVTPGVSNSGDSGEYIAGEGEQNASFTEFFMKLKPTVLVNDNIVVHSEWNLGDPTNNFFGRNVPNEDRKNALATGKGALDISVARLWLDVHSDFGTIQIGRAPMNWGLGAIFNSGDRPNDRYQSTSDTVRLVSKFGYLSLMPLFSKNAMGRNLSGARNPLTDAILNGSDDVTDYGIGLRYENPEEDLEGGVLYYKRNASDTQTSYYAPSTATKFTSGANNINVKLFDFYVKKSWHHFELGAELPLYSGVVPDVNGVGTMNDYKATAFALEAALKYDTWRHSLKMGTTPGQPAATTSAHGSTFSALQLHRAYKLGLILFNYNFGNFGPANSDAVPNGSTTNGYNYPTSVSPYDTGIMNAKYVMLASEKHWEQWGMNFGIIWAHANEAAVAGKDAYNHRTRQWFTSAASQGKGMGIEADFGTHYNWDDNISFGLDVGMLFPGEYFKYINNASKEGPANTVSAISFSATTTF